MEEVTQALQQLTETNRQLVQQNKKILEKLDGIKQDLARQKQEREAKKEFRAKTFKEMDIQYIMKHKGMGALAAEEILVEHGYDVSKITTSVFPSEKELERVLLHYEKKKNRATIEKW